MLFNSVSFAFFLTVVFLAHWGAGSRSVRWQNLILLLASFYFYASWNPFLLLLVIVTKTIDFYLGNRIVSEERIKLKKVWLITGILLNLGVLGYFKMRHFFWAPVQDTTQTLYGWQTESLAYIIPVGLSFYTLQSIGYLVDLYREETRPAQTIPDYLLFISFFPIILSGPIERAENLLSQIQKARVFDYKLAVNGLQQILWGLFKKVVIADNFASFGSVIFNNVSGHSGSTVLLGVFFFTIQIYCDFSGYSDMAIGTAKLFGIRLTKNFAFPYFSTSISQFWNSWHISLSRWLFNYIFQPVQFSLRRFTKFGTLAALLLTFWVSGMWHGLGNTFIVWGTLHAVYYIPMLFFPVKQESTQGHSGWKHAAVNVPKMCLTFVMVVFAWIFFRADSLSHAIAILQQISSGSLFTFPSFTGFRIAAPIIVIAIAMMIFEWRNRHYEFALAGIGAIKQRTVRWLVYYLLLFTTFYFLGNNQQFLYFRF